MKKHKGFTIIEIVVVITVIAILAAISIVSYNGIVDNANDTKIRTVVKTVADALAIYETKEGSRLNGEGKPAVAGGVDTMVPKYLTSDYRRGLKSKKSANSDDILRYYKCGSGSDGRMVVYASLTNPKPEEVNNFNAIRTRCGHGDTQAPTTGSTVYNYAYHL